jgi:hypothetical protein
MVFATVGGQYLYSACIWHDRSVEYTIDPINGKQHAFITYNIGLSTNALSRFQVANTTRHHKHPAIPLTIAFTTAFYTALTLQSLVLTLSDELNH